MPPLTPSISNVNYTFAVNHSCPNGTKIYLAYGLYYVASDLSFEAVKEKWNNGITDNDRLFYLQIQTLDLTKKYAEKVVTLQNIKNSGEPYSLRLFCEIKELYYQMGKNPDQIPDYSGSEYVDRFLAEKILSINLIFFQKEF